MSDATKIDEDVEEIVKAEAQSPKTTWGKIKDGLVKCLGALVMEHNGISWVVSIGRVSWWLAFGPALYIWVWQNKDIASNHYALLLILVAYNFSKKGITVLEQVLSKKLGG